MSNSQEHKEAPCQRTRELDQMWCRIAKVEKRQEAQGTEQAIMKGKVIAVAAVVGLVVSQIHRILPFLGGG